VSATKDLECLSKPLTPEEPETELPAYRVVLKGVLRTNDFIISVSQHPI
jgi:hypothetical protein